MKYAPVICSILTPEYLTEFVIHNYGFDGNTTCRILKTGINHSYLMATSEKKFVLRVYYLDRLFRFSPLKITGWCEPLLFYIYMMVVIFIYENNKKGDHLRWILDVQKNLLVFPCFASF